MESKVYSLIREHYEKELGCKNLIANILVPTRRRESAARVSMISSVSGIGDKNLTIEILRSVVMMGVGATSYEDIVAKISQSAEQVTARQLNSAAIGVLQLSLIAGNALWDVISSKRSRAK